MLEILKKFELSTIQLVVTYSASNLRTGEEGAWEGMSIAEVEVACVGLNEMF